MSTTAFDSDLLNLAATENNFPVELVEFRAESRLMRTRVSDLESDKATATEEI